MIKKLMMLCVAAMAAMGAMAVVEKSAVWGDWYEAHDIEEICMLNRWDDFAMGANVAIPVTGLTSPILASDVVVTAGTYSEFGRPYVLTEAEMWNRYGAPVLREKNLGNVEFDWYDNVWQNWDAEEDGAYGYELSADIWPNWSQVSGRQWILIPTGVPRSGTHTFSVKINGVEHDNYVVSFVMAEDQEPVPYVYKVSAVVAEGCEAMGKVTGGKTAKAGTKVTLKATVNKGYVFMGWYEDEACTKLCSAPGVDYTKASVKHTVVDDDQTLYAKFKPDGYEGGDGVEVLSSYGPFVPGAEVELNLGLVGYTAKKLPSGLKLNKKTGIVKGKAKKPGEYQVTFTKKGAETLTAKFIVGPMPTITITMEGDTEKCKVTGASKPGKGYLVGKKVSLSAKGPKGTAFTGWFKDGEPWPNETEYLESKLKYVMTEENLSLVARFEKEKMLVACDGLSALIVGEEVSIPITIETQSGVKSVKGSKLPSGLKVKKDKATGEWFVTGKPKKVGVWNATITVTTKSGAVEKLPVAVTVEDEGEVDLPSANHYFKEPLKNGEGEKYVVSVGISNVEDFLPNLKLTRGSLDVSGLPEGLKYDGASGKITGIATKAGTYTVTLTVTDSKMKYVSTITIEVEALPDWVVGTFDGWLQAIYEDSESDNLERIVIGITQVGKLSYKWYSQTDNDVMDEKDISLKKDIYGGYYITINEDWSDWKCDAVLEIKPLEIEGLFVGSIEGGGEGFEKEDGVWYKLFCSVQARQDCWIKAQDTIFSPKFVKGAITLIGMDDMRDWIWDDGYGGYLTLKYSANGAVTTSYSETEGGKAMATGSAQLVPYEVNGNITKAWLYTALKPKGRDAFGVLLFLSIDTSNGNVYGDDVTVEDYLLED